MGILSIQYWLHDILIDDDKLYDGEDGFVTKEGHEYDSFDHSLGIAKFNANSLKDCVEKIQEIIRYCHEDDFDTRKSLYSL